MDLEDYRIADCDFKGVIEKVEKKDHRFIKGPLPLPWFKKAFELPNGTLKVALILWYVSGLQKSKTFKLSNKRVFEFNVSRWTKYRALENLEAAGLIKVKRLNKESPNITILT